MRKRRYRSARCGLQRGETGVPETGHATESKTQRLSQIDRQFYRGIDHKQIVNILAKYYVIMIQPNEITRNHGLQNEPKYRSTSYLGTLFDLSTILDAPGNNFYQIWFRLVLFGLVLGPKAFFCFLKLT